MSKPIDRVEIITGTQRRRRYTAEDKIRIVLEGLRGEESIAALCRREGIGESLSYAWSKEFLGEALARHGFKRHAERETPPGG
jgi:transposase